MRCAAADLRAFLPSLPSDDTALRALLDDVGVEVKRVEHDPELGTLFTVELLANRGDHHCLQGVARECSGRIGGVVGGVETLPLRVGEAPVRLASHTDLCLVYTLTPMDLGQGAFEGALLGRLEASGVHSVSPAVDATNLVNHEIGQPTHVFDADTIVGGVTVRLSRPGEQAWPLFEEGPRAVPADSIVIADDERILAVAGVIGCEDSKVTDATTRVLIESACFDPVSVRKTARAMGLATDSSARFERGSDPSLAVDGAARVAWLLQQHAAATLTGPTGRVGSWVDPRRDVCVDLGLAAAYFQVPLTDDQVRQRLARYGFETVGGGEPDRPVFRVPPHRLWDVEHPEDLYEELAKSLGYNELPACLPVAPGVLPTAQQSGRARVEEVLLGAGFYEVVTNGFHAKSLRSRLGVEPGHPLFHHVETQNAEDKAFTLLKNDCLGQALELVEQNHRQKVYDVRAFEWTRTFHPEPASSNGVCSERSVLWVVASGLSAPTTWAGAARTSDVWLLKGLLEEIAVELSLPLRLGPMDPEAPLSSLLHDGRQATVLCGDVQVGLLGEVHPRLVKAFGLKRAPPVYLELGGDRLTDAGERPDTVLPPPRPPSVRSVAFALAPKLSAGQVAAVLRQAAPPWLHAVEIVDRYEGHDDDHEPLVAITFALHWRNDDGSRSTDDVNAATEGLVGAVHAAFGARARQRV